MAKVKHIALFKFKEGTSEEQIDQVFQEIMDISENISGIEDYVSGRNCSPQGFSQGYTHGYVMSFSDLAARDSYLGHPDHGKIRSSLDPHLESQVVFDFEI